MKHFILIIFCWLCTTANAQFDHCAVVTATGNLDFRTRGLATNDAGVGFALQTSFFSKKRLQLLLETGYDRFIGDKLYIMDTKENRKADIYNIKVGPRFFITKRIALSGTAGPAWHAVRTPDFSRDLGYNFAVTGFLGTKRHLVTQLSMTHISKEEENIKYLTFAVGYRF